MGIRRKLGSLFCKILRKLPDGGFEESNRGRKNQRGIALTYSSEPGGGGSGSQLQAIAAIYGLSMRFKLGFLDHPVEEIEMAPGSGLVTQDQRLAEVEKTNLLFRLTTSPIGLRAPSRLPKIKTLTPGIFLWLVLANYLFRFLKRPLVIGIMNPHRVSDSFPEVYKYAGQMWSQRFQNSERSGGSRHLSLSIHFRREALPQFLPSGEKNPRVLDSSWYDAVFSSTIRALGERGFRAICTVHTDYEKSLNREIAPFSAIGVAGLRAAGALSADGKKYREPEDLEFLNRAREEGMKILTGITPTSVFSEVANADVFIGGKSSMSFVAGLVRWGRPTIMPEFWHNCPPEWLQLQERESASPENLEGTFELIKSYLASFCFPATNSRVPITGD